MTTVAVIGTLAAVLTTTSFLPQIAKIRKQGGEDLSYAMLASYVVGVSLWLTYGILLHAKAVIWANAVAFLLVATCLVLKATTRKPMRRPRLAVDMDEVIADALTHHLAAYKAASGEELSVEEIRAKGVLGVLGSEKKKLFDSLPHVPGFFADLEPIAGSREALQLLSEKFDIFIVSAAMDVPFSFDDKFRWMQRHFPFISPQRIVFCGNKEIIEADYLVDDRSRQFKGFRGTGILFTAPHNAREKAALRADNWDEVLRILGVSRVEERSAGTVSLPGDAVQQSAS